MKYRVYSLRNFRQINQVQKYLSDGEKHAIEVVGNVLPFKVNNYVVDELIDWSDIPNDPLFQLTFPQRGMLSDDHFAQMESALQRSAGKSEIANVANDIRLELNPHPAGQQDNVPELDGVKLTGIQHKYRETLLFFPSNGQTCHAYCTFCFRWPQFVGMDEMKFAMRETELLTAYLREHPEVSDVLFTGGDPMVMSAKNFSSYIDPLLDADIESLRTIRIGTKSLSYWPYKFLTDKDADDMLRLFEKIVKSGRHLALMAHFNHPNELKTEAVQKAVRRILETGAQIRTQSPVMKYINDNGAAWTEMWREQLKLGCIPYYMFVARDTGAQDYFAVELDKAWRIYREGVKRVSGIGRTVRGPSMSADPGKVHILGVTDVNNEKVFVLQFIQGRNPDWVYKPFFARYDPDAVWLDDLEPAFDNDEFFFDQGVDSAGVLVH